MTRRDLFKRAMGMLAAVPCLKWLGRSEHLISVGKPMYPGLLSDDACTAWIPTSNFTKWHIVKGGDP